VTTIELGILEGGPYAGMIRSIAERCAEEPGVLAAWVGGSLASGKGDVYSDIDFRIAVAPGEVEAWSAPDWSRLLPAMPVGRVILRFGEKTLLHHMVLADGAIVDFLVLDSTAEMPEPSVAILFCHDPALRSRIAAFATPAASLVRETTSAAIRQVLVEYWIASHKHLKALARKYDESLFVGLYVERTALLRALFIEATGKDIDARMSLHMTGALHKGLADRLTPYQKEILGLPTITVQEAVAAIEAVRDEMVRVGRVLAQRHGFDYPADLEAVVRRLWGERKEEVTRR